ncbi:hypothetical protein B0H14DRAFT_2390189, partial [Mycena olivaceomarginata]
PDYFIVNHGHDKCEIVDCQTDTSEQTTVQEFFKFFGQNSKTKKKIAGCYKLKDWPPQNDFRAQFPNLFNDFHRAVLIPNYVCGDGVLNIASHFPTNAVPPDLGPKMYIAYGNPKRTVSGSKGSTKLHMDMADALNIMTYTADQSDGDKGCAAWDIFRAADSDKLRDFL